MFALLLALALGELPPPIMPFPTGQTQTVHIVEWDGNALPRPIQRSEQLPLSDQEVLKLAKAGFDGPQLARLIEERRCACDASADGLIRFKSAGVPKDALAAISLHALKPNRALTLELTFDFAGEGNQAREGFFYFFVDDGDVTRVFSAPVGELLSRKHAHEEMVDRRDLLIAHSVRRVRIAGDVALKTYGKHTVLVAYSASPAILHPSQLGPAERAKAQGYTFVYPRSSLQSVCKVASTFKRDALLPDKWHFQGSQFACEFD
jgi:hypothetical protein